VSRHIDGCANVRSVFNDFGNDFTCVDATGENPQSGMIVHIEEVRRCCPPDLSNI
jgi:hypothetical protein